MPRSLIFLLLCVCVFFCDAHANRLYIYYRRQKWKLDGSCAFYFFCIHSVFILFFNNKSYVITTIFFSLSLSMEK